MDEDNLREKIHAAKEDVAEAAAALDRLVKEIAVATRAEKTTITTGVEEALAKLRAALAVLVDLEAALAVVTR